MLPVATQLVARTVTDKWPLQNTLSLPTQKIILYDQLPSTQLWTLHCVFPQAAHIAESELWLDFFSGQSEAKGPLAAAPRTVHKHKSNHDKPRGTSSNQSKSRFSRFFPASWE